MVDTEPRVLPDIPYLKFSYHLKAKESNHVEFLERFAGFSPGFVGLRDLDPAYHGRGPESLIGTKDFDQTRP